MVVGGQSYDVLKPLNKISFNQFFKIFNQIAKKIKTRYDTGKS